MNYNFKKIYNFGEYNFVENTTLNDSSSDMSRLLNTFEKGFMIISACRSSFDIDKSLPNYEELVKQELDKYNIDYNKYLEKYSFEEIKPTLLREWNLAKTKQLENDLASYGFGFRASMGGFIENGKEQADEMPFVVPYEYEDYDELEFVNIALKLCKKYNQDSVLVMIPSLEQPFWLNQNADIDAIFKKKPKLNTNNDYYTKTNKTNSKPFTFEMIDSVKKRVMLVNSNDHKLRKVYDRYGWRKK